MGVFAQTFCIAYVHTPLILKRNVKMQKNAKMQRDVKYIKHIDKYTTFKKVMSF